MSPKIYMNCRKHGPLTRSKVAIVGIKRILPKCIQCRKEYNRIYRQRPEAKKKINARHREYSRSQVLELKENYLKDLCVHLLNVKGRKNVTPQMVIKMRKQVIDRRQRLANFI